MLKALMCGLSGFHRDFVSQQNFPTDSLSEESEFCISLTTTKCKIGVKPVRELVGFVNINKIPKLIKPGNVFDDVHWFGMNHCTDCNLIDTYCTCVYEMQSGTPDDTVVTTDSKDLISQNVEFTDQVEPYMLEILSTVDPTRKLQDAHDAELGNFFSRPIKIYDSSWATSTVMSWSIDPWELFWSDPKNKARIANFALARCTLKIKIIINGNAFMYGRAMVGYQPFPYKDDLSTFSALEERDLVQLSQLPHIFLDPCTSQGGEMTLPFFWHANYIDVSGGEWGDLGALHCRTMNMLKHANGATDIVTTSVFAWAEDVELSVLTSLEPQSGEEIDEANAKGVISGPATALSAWSAHMVKVPYIGPFAMATSIAAGATAQIARLFGYSRPTVTKTPDQFRPIAMSSLAVTNVPDNCQKLSVDHKQELSIDPRIAGLGGVDPLNIREIAKRESYLTQFQWSRGTTPETMLWNSRVSPVLWRQGPDLTSSYHFPACAFAALPFKYWTGTMKFRFQIVCSGYHKGRLKFVYDPKYLKTNNYNTNYLHIVDISEEQDFTIEIGQGRHNNIVRHHQPGIDTEPNLFKTIPFTAEETGNGVIGVYVVNELTVPNSIVDNDISINVYVSMGDDFEVFVPDDWLQHFVCKPPGIPIPPEAPMEPQSGIAHDQQDTKEPSAPQQNMSMKLGPGRSEHPDLHKVFFGESIVTLRTLLKRYNLWTCTGTASNGKILRGRNPTFPYLRGAVPGAVDRTADNVAYNYSNTVMLHWVRLAFQGWRGTIRYKFVPRGMYGHHNVHGTVQRAPWNYGGENYQREVTGYPTYPTIDGMRLNTVMASSPNGTPVSTSPFSGMLGSLVTIGNLNAILEFELPWYSQWRFEPGKPVNYTSSMRETAPYDFRFEYTTGVVANNTTDMYVAAGEDFQVYFFTGLPRMYYEAQPPNAG
jgi:hypothetical protein